ncbi:MAG: hypothetical protein EOP83_08095 [Verrucomicrobiaceae bacterium]|nr:MAG: hypothetical protein EOP83_08095 [Verrucomicrobiaceae bacterium]
MDVYAALIFVAGFVVDLIVLLIAADLVHRMGVYSDESVWYNQISLAAGIVGVFLMVAGIALTVPTIQGLIG